MKAKRIGIDRGSNEKTSGSGRADHGLSRHKWFDIALPMATAQHTATRPWTSHHYASLLSLVPSHLLTLGFFSPCGRRMSRSPFDETCQAKVRIAGPANLVTFTA